MRQQRDQTIAEGLKAFKSIQDCTVRGFDWWLAVGHGLDAGRSLLMERLQVNTLDSFNGRRAYSDWLTQSGYREVHANIRRILLLIVNPENLGRIREWMAGLTPAQRLVWNHPASIWNNFRRTHTVRVNVRSHQVLVRMSTDQTGVHRVINPIIPPIATVEYIGLIADIVSFLAKRDHKNDRTILRLIAEAVTPKTAKPAPTRRRAA
jgi:hypothetical protein